MKANILSRRAILVVLFFWWTSAPPSEAITEATDISGFMIIKVILRALVLLYIVLRIPQVLIVRDRSSKWAFVGYMNVLWLYLLVCGLSIIVSANKFVSSFRWLDTVSIVCLSVIFLNEIRCEKEINVFLGDLLFAAEVLLICTVVLFFFAPDWGSRYSGLDPYSGEPTNKLGACFLRGDLLGGLSLMLFLFYLRCLTTSNAMSKIRAYFFISLSSFVIFMNHIRSSLIIAFVLGGFAIRKSTGRPVLRYLSIFLVIAAVVYWSTILQVLTRKASSEELLTLNNRTWVWKTLLSDFSKSPATIVIGTGYLTNSSTGLEFNVPKMGRFMTSPHNGYLSVLIGTGICGFICVSIITGSWFKLRKELKDSKTFPIEAVHLANLGAILHTTVSAGIWGTPSPEMVLFIMFFVAAHRSSWLKMKGML